MDNTQKLVSLLKDVKPGFQPFDVFIELARIVTLSIVEWVPLRLHDGKVEVLLLPRSSDDPFWPAELHTPGTVLRATDGEGYSKVYERIEQDELNGTEVSDPVFVTNILHSSKRGSEHSSIYWVEVTGEPKIGVFYDTDNLPKNLVESQRAFIASAVASYRKAGI